jgi:fructose/tagatose bisphosphate aldolase
MPVPDFKTYCAILDRARAGRFALPAVNVTSLTTANAVLRGLADSKADGIIQNYDDVLKVDGELGNKKLYDPRSYLALAETAMAERVKQAASDLRASGKTMFAS